MIKIILHTFLTCLAALFDGIRLVRNQCDQANSLPLLSSWPLTRYPSSRSQIECDWRLGRSGGRRRICGDPRASLEESKQQQENRWCKDASTWFNWWYSTEKKNAQRVSVTVVLPHSPLLSAVPKLVEEKELSIVYHKLKVVLVNNTLNYCKMKHVLRSVSDSENTLFTKCNESAGVWRYNNI